MVVVGVIFSHYFLILMYRDYGWGVLPSIECYLYCITMAPKWQLVPKSDVKQQFTTRSTVFCQKVHITNNTRSAITQEVYYMWNRCMWKLKALVLLSTSGDDGPILKQHYLHGSCLYRAPVPYASEVVQTVLLVSCYLHFGVFKMPSHHVSTTAVNTGQYIQIRRVTVPVPSGAVMRDRAFASWFIARSIIIIKLSYQAFKTWYFSTSMLLLVWSFLYHFYYTI